jgi:hypothetical protein
MAKNDDKQLKSVRRALRDAQTTSALVDVVSIFKTASTVQGFVVAVSTDWVVLRELDDSLFLDGYSAIRLEVVKKVRPVKDRERFIEELLSARGQWPVEPLVGNFIKTKDVVRFIWASGNLVRIYEGTKHPEKFWVGIPYKPKKRSVTVECLDPDGTWSPKPGKFWYGYTTRLSWGHLYETTLREIAGPAPTDSDRHRPRQ